MICIAKAWRPISLTNYLVKALERLAGWKMDEAIQSHPIHTMQHGFRNDRNTETAVSEVADYIEKNIYNNKFVIAIFLDIQAAFDTIKPALIKEKLLEHGGDSKMVNWYYNYITHRNINVEIQGIKVSLTTRLGFPQGGVCSAKFWIIAFNEAINIINTHGAVGHGFADDCATMIGGVNLHTMMSRLQKVCTELQEWGNTAGLTFNSSKTVVIIFTKKHVKPTDMPNKLKISGQDIDFSHDVKYLGVTLDSRMLWDIHFNNIIKRSKQYLFMLKKAVYKAWGPKALLIKWIYTAIVRPRLTYCSIAW